MISVELYYRPEDLQEALYMLATGDYTPIAGGTDLIPRMRDGRPRRILELGRLDLDSIRDKGDGIEIGALATHTAVASDSLVTESLPALARACSLVGTQQIRNRGTIGGNIVNASPCADTVPALLLYDADLVFRTPAETRTVPLSHFILGPYATDLRRGELLQSIICKKTVMLNGWSYIKLGRRQAVNISRMTIAATMSIEDGGKIASAKISAGSVFPAPSRMQKIEKMLEGEIGSPALYEAAANAAVDLMIAESGVRWSTPYKKPVLVGLLMRALSETQRRAGI
jgi:CO/xanthine dehydrogenase FAD-binding subunit